MNKKRLMISLEFCKNRNEEVELYFKLRKYSNSSGIIKDILKGIIPVSILDTELSKEEKEEIKKLMED